MPPEAVSDPVYTLPTAPVAGNEPEMFIVWVGAEIRIETANIAVCPLESVTIAVKAEVPAVVGVPETIRVAVAVPEAITPAGSPATVHMKEPLLPVAVRVPRYPTPTVPVAGTIGVIVTVVLPPQPRS